MNFYNPYMYSMPLTQTPRLGLFSRIFGNINFSNILNGTQRTLNIVNQTIPLIKQAQPIFKNAKTMFKVMNEFKKIDTNSNYKSNNQKISNTEIVKEKNNNLGPTFFA